MRICVLVLLVCAVTAVFAGEDFGLDETHLSLTVQLPGDTGVLERVSRMTALKSLSLHVKQTGPRPLDLSFLSGQRGLEKLYLGTGDSNRLDVVSLSPLAETSVSELYMSGAVRLLDVSSLSSLTNLVSFSASGESGPDTVRNLPRTLECLDMSSAQEGDYCGCFTNLVRLKSLKQDLIFSRSQNLWVEDIHAMPRLQELELGIGAELMGLGEIRGCRDLTSLTLSDWGFRLQDISALKGLPLKNLTLRRCLVRSLKGMESLPVESLFIDFCPIPSMDAFGVHPSVREVVLLRTGIASVARDEVLRHFPNIWRFVYGDLMEGFCDGDRENKVMDFGPTNVVLSASAPVKDGFFMGYDLNLPIRFAEDEERGSLLTGIDESGREVCSWYHRFEHPIQLSGNFHGFTEMTVVSERGSDAGVNELSFVRAGAQIPYDEKLSWCATLCRELSDVYGAEWESDGGQPDLYVSRTGKSRDFVFEILCGDYAQQQEDGFKREYTEYKLSVLRLKGGN